MYECCTEVTTLTTQCSYTKCAFDPNKKETLVEGHYKTVGPYFLKKKKKSQHHERQSLRCCFMITDIRNSTLNAMHDPELECRSEKISTNDMIRTICEMWIWT